MKTILENEGNKRLFRENRSRNRREKSRAYGFTVNVWLNRGPVPSYDAGFFNGRAQRTTRFQSPIYREGVGYRIRVIPKV